MSDEEGNDNIADKARRGAESSNRLVYAVIALISSLLVCAIFSNGLANLGMGKVLGDGWRSIGTVISQTYCAALGDPQPCPSITQSVSAWFNQQKVKTGLQLAGITPVPGSDQGSPAGSSTSIPPTAVIPPTAQPTVAAIPQGLIDAVSKATVDWQSTHDVTSVRNELDMARAQYPQEAPVYQPWITLTSKLDQFQSLTTSLQTAQADLMAGNTPDPQAYVAKVQAFVNACTAYVNATHDINPNPLADNCQQNSTALTNLITAYAKATASGAKPEDFAATVKGPWQGTGWTITTWDDRFGSCHCASITGTTPDLIKGLVLPAIPTDAIKQFDDSPAVGQEITWP